MKNYIIASILIILIALAGYFIFADRISDNNIPVGVNFLEEGNLTINNPGQKPDVWYLVYEKPGFPAISVELKKEDGFSGFSVGDKVSVEGVLQDSVVTVNSITHVANNDTGIKVKLYYYNPDLDEGVGGVQCSKKGLVAVERIIPNTTAPLTETIKLLLRGEITEGERASGVTSEFPLAGLSLSSATIINGVATLTLNDPQNKTVGGSCRTGVLWAQIEETAKQFSTVNSVRFLPEELFQP